MDEMSHCVQLSQTILFPPPCLTDCFKYSSSLFSYVLRLMKICHLKLDLSVHKVVSIIFHSVFSLGLGNKTIAIDTSSIALRKQVDTSFDEFDWFKHSLVKHLGEYVMFGCTYKPQMSSHPDSQSDHLIILRATNDQQGMNNKSCQDLF